MLKTFLKIALSNPFFLVTGVILFILIFCAIMWLAFFVMQCYEDLNNMPDFEEDLNFDDSIHEEDYTNEEETKA